MNFALKYGPNNIKNKLNLIQVKMPSIATIVNLGPNRFRYAERKQNYVLNTFNTELIIKISF